MTRWIRNRPERAHDVAAGLAAGVAGIVVGAGVFWLARLLGAREPLPESRSGELPARGPSEDGGDRAGSEEGAAGRTGSGGGGP